MPGDIDAFVALGANLGDGAATLRAAAAGLAALPRTRLIARSGLYRSAPIESHGPDYWNAVVRLRTGLAAEALLDALLAIEATHGRLRPAGEINAPRTLDLDLLLYGSFELRTPRLTLPHPRMAQRAFVLAPLSEVWPEGTIDATPVAQLAARCIARGQTIDRIGPL